MVFIKTLPVKRFTMYKRKAYTTNFDIDLMTEIRELAQGKAKHQNDLDRKGHSRYAEK